MKAIETIIEIKFAGEWAEWSVHKSKRQAAKAVKYWRGRMSWPVRIAK